MLGLAAPYPGLGGDCLEFPHELISRYLMERLMER